MEHKSEQVKQTALANGWKSEVRTNLDSFEQSDDVNDIQWDVYAMRDKETIHVLYIGDRFEEGTYKYGDHVVELSRRGEAVKFLTGKPDPRKFHKKRREFTDSYDDVIQDRSVPWEHDSPAIDILLAVVRKEIKWVRRFDGQICFAVVDVNLKERGSAKHFRVYESKNGRVLEWADALGFHAVALDQIIDVL